MDGLLYAPFNSIFVSERWAGDNERMCAMEPRLERSLPQAGLEPVTLD